MRRQSEDIFTRTFSQLEKFLRPTDDQPSQSEKEFSQYVTYLILTNNGFLLFSVAVKLWQPIKITIISVYCDFILVLDGFKLNRSFQLMYYDIDSGLQRTALQIIFYVFVCLTHLTQPNQTLSRLIWASITFKKTIGNLKSCVASARVDLFCLQQKLRFTVFPGRRPKVNFNYLDERI